MLVSNTQAFTAQNDHQAMIATKEANGGVVIMVEDRSTGNLARMSLNRSELAALRGAVHKILMEDTYNSPAFKALVADTTHIDSTDELFDKLDAFGIDFDDYLAGIAKMGKAER